MMRSIIDKLRRMRKPPAVAATPPLSPEELARLGLHRLNDHRALFDNAPSGAAREIAARDTLSLRDELSLLRSTGLTLVEDASQPSLGTLDRSVALLPKGFPQSARRLADVVEDELDMADDRRTLEQAHPDFFREFWDLRAHIKFDGGNFSLVDRETAGDLADRGIDAAHQRACDLCRRLLDFHPHHLASLRIRFAVFSSAVAWSSTRFDPPSSRVQHDTAERPRADDLRPPATVLRPRADEGSGP